MHFVQITFIIGYHTVARIDRQNHHVDQLNGFQQLNQDANQDQNQENAANMLKSPLMKMPFRIRTFQVSFLHGSRTQTVTTSKLWTQTRT